MDGILSWPVDRSLRTRVHDDGVNDRVPVSHVQFMTAAALLAIVTGGGTGMGRELVRQLTAEGCNVATRTTRRRDHATVRQAPSS